MRSCRVRNDDDFRFGQRHQIRYFAFSIGAHLQHGEFVVIGNSQQHQRHADVIVEISLSRKCRRLLFKAGSDQFLNCCLAIAAGNTNYHDIFIAAPGRAETTERLLRVVNSNLCNICINESVYNRRGRAVFFCCADIIMSIKIGASQREE